MKLQADMKAFRAALAAAGKVIPTKTPIPIALCIKIATNDNRITLTGTNFDMTFEMEMAADVLTEGVTCVGFAALNAFCAAAKGDAVMIEADNKAATIRAGKSRIVLGALDPRDFPNYLPAEGELVQVDPTTFVRAVKFCVAAAGEEDTRYYLKGAAVLEQGDRVQVWGSDGHCLHHADLPRLEGIGGGGIIPTEAALFIVGQAEKADSLHMMVSPTGWHMRTGPIRAWGKVIDGTYPDCQRLVASFTGWRDFLIAPREEVAQALTVAACGADTVSGGSKSLAVTATSSGPVVLRGARGAAGIVYAGRAETMTKAVSDAGFMVSSAIFQRALTALSVPEVVLAHTDREGASCLRLTPAQGDATLILSALVMGMRATSEELADAA